MSDPESDCDSMPELVWSSDSEQELVAACSSDGSGSSSSSEGERQAWLQIQKVIQVQRACEARRAKAAKAAKAATPPPARTMRTINEESEVNQCRIQEALNSAMGLPTTHPDFQAAQAAYHRARMVQEEAQANAAHDAADLHEVRNPIIGPGARAHMGAQEVAGPGLPAVLHHNQQKGQKGQKAHSQAKLSNSQKQAARRCKSKE